MAFYIEITLKNNAGKSSFRLEIENKPFKESVHAVNEIEVVIKGLPGFD